MIPAARTLDIIAEIKARLSDPKVLTYWSHMLSSSLDQPIRSEQAQADLGRMVRQALEIGEAYYLADDMLPVVMAAADALEGTETFRADIWPTSAGFALIEDSFQITDKRGKTLSVSALQWWRSSARTRNGEMLTGTWLVEYTDSQDPRDDINREMAIEAPQMMRALGRFQPMHMQFLPDGARFGPMLIPSAVREPSVTDEQLEAEAIMAVNTTRLLVAFSRMLAQRITAVTHLGFTTKQTARYTKRRLPSRVTVVRLRARVYVGSDDDTEATSHVEWSHRWVVRGHWRNQPVSAAHPHAEPNPDGSGFIARLFIAPYVKGPDGKPLVLTSKVYALVD